MVLKKAPDGPKHGGEESAVQTGNTCSEKRDPRQGFLAKNCRLRAVKRGADVLY